MSSIKKVSCLFLALLFLAGCQQEQKKRQDLRVARGLRGSTMINPGQNAASAVAQCGSYSVPGKVWGEVTSYQGDQAFLQEVQILTSPVLSTLPADDQLGFVSGQSGQRTGVRFWGNATVMNAYGNGAIDPNSAEIRMEIFDSQACQLKADGTIRPVIPIHIGAGQPGFAGFEGYVNGGMARLTFSDNYGVLILDGQISGSFYTGLVQYTTAGTGGQARILGRFQIPVQGFFSFL
jgi:hypothetical protein